VDITSKFRIIFLIVFLIYKNISSRNCRYVNGIPPFQTDKSVKERKLGYGRRKVIAKERGTEKKRETVKE
jgi:hypothetical protein